MKSDTLLLLGLVGLYLYSKSSGIGSGVIPPGGYWTMTPGPGQPGFVGPVQVLPSASVPPNVNGPINTSIQWMSCGIDPNADPVMCQQLGWSAGMY